MNRESKERLATAIAVLKTDEPALSLRAKATLRAAVEEQIAIDAALGWHRWLTAPRAAVAVAAVASLACVGMALTRTPKTPPPRVAATETPPREADVAQPAFAWKTMPVGLHVRRSPAKIDVSLERGDGVFDGRALAGTRRLSVRTPHATIATVGARFRLRVDADRTKVWTLTGVLEVRSGEAIEKITARNSWVSSTPEKKTKAVRAPRTLPAPPAASASGGKVDALPAVPRPASEMTRADRLRRSGRFTEAAAVYRTVWRNEWGGPFREEALLREAQMLSAAGQTTEARTTLQEGLRRFPTGPLAPERRALAEKLEGK